MNDELYFDEKNRLIKNRMNDDVIIEYLKKSHIEKYSIGRLNVDMVRDLAV